jgi:hypothetical protein
MTPRPESDSFHVSINGEAERIFETGVWAPVWQWVRLTTFTASSPKDLRYTHQLRNSVNEISFRCREPYTLLARLLITSDPNFIPAEIASSRVAAQIRRTNYGPVLRWPSSAGITYQVLFTPAISAQPWKVSGEPVVAIGPETEWRPSDLPVTSGFFWVYAGM